MAQKYLGINTGQGKPEKTFPLTQVDDNTFMISTKDSMIDIVQTCTQWVTQNPMVGQSAYCKMIEDRTCLIQDLDDGIIKALGENLLDDSEQAKATEEMMLEKKVDCSDNLFFGGEGELLQWSISEKRIIETYEGIEGYVTAQRTTADMKYLFFSGEGEQMQLDIDAREVIHDFGKLGDMIYSIATTFDNKHLFVIPDGKLLQYQISDHELVKEYQFDGHVCSVVATFNNAHVFVGLADGSLHQICMDSQTVIKVYEKIHEDSISSLAVTRDNNFVIALTPGKRVKKISIRDQQVVKDFGELCFLDDLRTIQLAPGDETLFVYDYGCYLKLIDLTDGKTIKDFGEVHSNFAAWGEQLSVTRDGEYLFAATTEGDLKQYSVRDRALVEDFGEMCDGIWSVGN